MTNEAMVEDEVRDYFNTGGSTLSEWAADGDANAQTEIERRIAKRAMPKVQRKAASKANVKGKRTRMASTKPPSAAQIANRERFAAQSKAAAAERHAAAMQPPPVAAMAPAPARPASKARKAAPSATRKAPGRQRGSSAGRTAVQA